MWGLKMKETSRITSMLLSQMPEYIYFFCCFVFCFLIYFFKFYFIFKLYIIVLVLPNIKMNPPQVYMCCPSWTLLPPPSPYHPYGSSQCTSPKHPVSCIEHGLATRFIHDIIHVSMPFDRSCLIFRLPPHWLSCSISQLINKHPDHLLRGCGWLWMGGIEQNAQQRLYTWGAHFRLEQTFTTADKMRDGSLLIRTRSSALSA